MADLFGTDGIRGIANEELTPELVYHAARAAGVFFCGGTEKDSPFVVIGRDTRLSGDMLASAAAAGFMSVGCSIRDIKVASTPAVAYVTQQSEAAGGLVVSASHNPWQYNGIKFVCADGSKLSREDEEKIEALIQKSQYGQLSSPQPAFAGQFVEDDDSLALYHSALIQLVEEEVGRTQPFAGLRVVLDCGNGAAVASAPQVLRELGAQVSCIGAEPNGRNINEGVGSLHPEVVAQRVETESANLGFAFDGDADRVLAAAEDGSVLDGDYVMGLCAREMARRGHLPHNLIVTTVMSNVALELFLEEVGVKVERTPVGDREVYARMQETGAALGGEQSGHIIFADYSQTGDGLLTALQVIIAVIRNEAPLSMLVQDFEPLPQKLVNVEVEDKEFAVRSEPVREAVAEVEEALSDSGRVLVRPSGTEPVVRVMVEGPAEEELEKLAARIAKAVRRSEGDENK
jgi:phosphoglucosamine mutase